jgi:hypothetical protein
MFTPRPGKFTSDKGNELIQAAEDSRRQIEKLRGDVDRLTLTVQSMWELLKKMTEMDDDVLMKMIHEVDGRDGKVDGRPSRTLENCPKCNRPVSLATGICVYCGTAVERKHPF